MKRYGSVLGLKPEAVADYVRVHAAVWPEMLQALDRHLGSVEQRMARTDQLRLVPMIEEPPLQS